ADEQQIEQALLRFDRIDKRGCDRHGVLERRVLAITRPGVEDERVALEEFVLVVLDDRLAGAREALPVQAMQRIARAVVPQREKLLRVADRGRQRHPALLELARSGKREQR